jgi:hemolysin activation/secretion protein
MREILQKIFYLTAILTLFAISVGWSAPPDAGQLIREQQTQRQLPTQIPQPEAEKQRTPMVDTGVSVNVKGFKFTGYEGLVKESDLQALVAGAIGKNLNFNELQEQVVKVTAYLKDKGWFLARAYLPKQDVTSGMIEIAIVLGTSDGSVLIKRSTNARIDEGFLRHIGEKAVSPGQPLSESRLERALLLMNDLPGINAHASLAPGATSGSTAVQINVNEGPLFSGAIWGDNYGNHYTGDWRGSAMVSVNDPLSYGDQLTAMVTGAQGIIQGKVAYDFPLIPGGPKGHMSYTGMAYEIKEDMSDLDLEGWSTTLNTGLSHPIVRSRKFSLSTSFFYEYKNLIDKALDEKINDRVLNSGILTFQGDEYDTVLGGGYTTFNAGATFGDMNEEIADIDITDVEGTYTHFNFGAARLQRLFNRVAVNVSYAGQLSLDNLDSSEKFILGGPNGVRAYPVGEASGDEGHLFNVDLRYDLPVPTQWGMLQLSGFYDAGHIKLHHDAWENSIETATNKNRYWLQGYGAGLFYAYKQLLSVNGYWAHIIDHNPGRSDDDENADGREDKYRFWVQAALNF